MTPASSPRTIVTGASGFVGRALVARLGAVAHGLSLGAAGWRERIEAAPWPGATVFHLAARVHQPGGDEGALDQDNVEKTAVIAEAAARGGARRLVFLSSIKVNGEESGARPFRPEDSPAPRDAYAHSKWRAELALADIARHAGLATVIVRAPLVVGPGAQGNLRALLRLAASGLPLPFGAIENRRTLVDVDDLAALLCACAAAPDIAGRLFLAGDPRPVSTRELLVAIRGAWSLPSRLFRVRPATLERMAALAGRSATMRRLTRSLEADVAATLSDLPWSPSMPLPDAVARMARAHRSIAPPA